MSSRRPKKEQDYNQKISITKTTITQELSNDEDRNESNNYDEESLNDVIKAFEYFDMNHRGKIKISELIKALSSFGNIMTGDEIYNIFRAAGIEINHSEEIDYMQFINFWVGNK